MSYRSPSHHPDPGPYADQWAYEYPQGHPQTPYHPQAAAPRPKPQAPQQRQRRQGWADYTLVHGRRQVRLGPVAFWIVVGSLVAMAGWSVLTGTYFAFHDDVLKRLIARQAEMQYAYEDRIAELRAQVDRITSRQLLDQEQFEQKLEALVRKQSTLEQRASTLGSMPDMTPTGSIPKPGRSSDASRGTQIKPSAVGDTVIFQAPPDREARLESRAAPAFNMRNAARTRGGMEGALARMQESLERMEANQSHSLSALEEISRRARDACAASFPISASIPARPRPCRPPAAPSAAHSFPPIQRPRKSRSNRQLYRIHLSRSQVERLTRTLSEVPVRKPVTGEIDMSSSFGMRMDPFLRSPAMHTGLDMRGDTGDPVRATANGTVTSAGPNGGYGKMVEIEHRNGLSTRYAHLSSIDVKVGQVVKIGQIVGKIGSTGRSTGPHLHYETRVDGEAVDPQKYLRAGIRLGLN